MSAILKKNPFQKKYKKKFFLQLFSLSFFFFDLFFLFSLFLYIFLRFRFFFWFYFKLHFFFAYKHNAQLDANLVDFFSCKIISKVFNRIKKWIKFLSHFVLFFFNLFLIVFARDVDVAAARLLEGTFFKKTKKNGVHQFTYYFFYYFVVLLHSRVSVFFLYFFFVF